MEDDDDNWDLDNDDWGDLDFMDNDKKKNEKAGGAEENKNKSDKNRMNNLFFGGAKDAVGDLEDLDDIGNNFMGAKNEDKFN